MSQFWFKASEEPRQQWKAGEKVEPRQVPWKPCYRAACSSFGLWLGPTPVRCPLSCLAYQWFHLHSLNKASLCLPSRPAFVSTEVDVLWRHGLFSVFCAKHCLAQGTLTRTQFLPSRGFYNHVEKTSINSPDGLTSINSQAQKDGAASFYCEKRSQENSTSDTDQIVKDEY